jgi:hypothetical protein
VERNDVIDGNGLTPFSGIDYVQEKFLGGGPQNNENAAEQAKDRFIADQIRGQYKSATGKDFPIKEKTQEPKPSGGGGGLGGLF